MPLCLSHMQGLKCTEIRYRGEINTLSFYCLNSLGKHVSRPLVYLLLWCVIFCDCLRQLSPCENRPLNNRHHRMSLLNTIMLSAGMLELSWEQANWVWGLSHPECISSTLKQSQCCGFQLDLKLVLSVVPNLGIWLFMGWQDKSFHWVFIVKFRIILSL